MWKYKGIYRNIELTQSLNELRKWLLLTRKVVTVYQKKRLLLLSLFLHLSSTLIINYKHVRISSIRQYILSSATNKVSSCYHDGPVSDRNLVCVHRSFRNYKTINMHFVSWICRSYHLQQQWNQKYLQTWTIFWRIGLQWCLQMERRSWKGALNVKNDRGIKFCRTNVESFRLTRQRKRNYQYECFL